MKIQKKMEIWEGVGLGRGGGRGGGGGQGRCNREVKCSFCEYSKKKKMGGGG